MLVHLLIHLFNYLLVRTPQKVEIQNFNMQTQANYSCVAIYFWYSDIALLWCIYSQFPPLIRILSIFIYSRAQHEHKATIQTCNRERKGGSKNTLIESLLTYNNQIVQWPERNISHWLVISKMSNIETHTRREREHGTMWYVLMCVPSSSCCYQPISIHIENDANYQMDKRLLLVFSIKWQTLHWFHFNWPVRTHTHAELNWTELSKAELCYILCWIWCDKKSAQ